MTFTKIETNYDRRQNLVKYLLYDPWDVLCIVIFRSSNDSEGEKEVHGKLRFLSD